MKFLKYFSLILMAMLSFTACETLDDDGPNDDGLIMWNDFFNATITRCERIGGVLQVEYELTNKCGEDKTFNIEGGHNTGTDNLNNQYYVYCAFGESDYDTKRSVTVRKGETVVGKFKIKDFDPSNNASTVNIATRISISGEELDDNVFLLDRVDIDDYRVTNNGVQTCDTALVFNVVRCERVGAALQLDYTITNISSRDLSSFEVKGAHNTATDNLNNEYYTDLAFGESSYSGTRTVGLEAGQTVLGHIKISNFDPSNQAKTLNATLTCATDDYVLSDNKVRFFNIPITDNRVMKNGIQTCDTALVFKTTSSVIDENDILTVKFTISNKTNFDINGFTLSAAHNTSTDDLDNSYYTYIALENGEFSTRISTNIEAGKTVECAIKIEDFNNRAKTVSATLPCSAKNYELTDNKVRILTIPITKQ